MAIIDNLVSYWKLDEASGNRADAHASNTLTDNNTVGSASGIINDGASFINANSEKLTRASQTWGIANAWSFSFWATCDNVAVNPRIFQLRQTSSNNNEIMVLFQNISTGYFYVSIGNNGSGSKVYKFLPASITTLTHYVVTWDGTTLKLYENGVEKTPVKDSDSSVTQTDVAREFTLGSHNNGSAFLTGIMDEVGLWAKTLTSTEVSDLYNSGAGLAYPFSAGSASASPSTSPSPSISSSPSPSVSSSPSPSESSSPSPSVSSSPSPSESASPSTSPSPSVSSSPSESSSPSPSVSASPSPSPSSSPSEASSESSSPSPSESASESASVSSSPSPSESASVSSSPSPSISSSPSPSVSSSPSPSVSSSPSPSESASVSSSPSPSPSASESSSPSPSVSASPSTSPSSSVSASPSASLSPSASPSAQDWTPVTQATAPTWVPVSKNSL